MSRGGRLDLAAACLPRVTTPTLLLARSDDRTNLDAHRAALPWFGGPVELEVLRGVSARDPDERWIVREVSCRASRWFRQYFKNSIERRFFEQPAG